MNNFRLVALALGAVISLPVFALDAHGIMAKNDEIRRASQIVSDAVLTTGGGSTPARVKKFKWWRKLVSGTNYFNTLTRFDTPAEVHNEGILFLEGKDGSQVLMYLPNFKKIRRVQNQDQSGSFMGSEFSFSDISAPPLEDFDYKSVRTEDCVAGGKCEVIEATPKTDIIRDRTGYGRRLAWIRQDNFMADREEFYDAKDKLIKKLTASDNREIDAKNHKWLSHKLRMESPTTGRFTVLEFSNVKTSTDLADSLFTPQNLERVQ